MSDEVPVDFPSQMVVACEVCGRSGDVPWYCKNCQGSLCDTCKEAHRETAISRRHSVVPRTGEVLRLHGPARIAEQCSRHKTKEISTYCNECQVACCVTCLAESHKRHDFCPIEDAYLSTEKRLNDYIKQLQGDVKTQLQDLVNQGQEIAADNAHHIQKSKDEVNAFRAEVKHAVDEAFDSLINNLEKPNSDVTDTISSLKLQIQKIDELIIECTDKIREGKLDLIKYTPPTPSSLIPKVNLPQANYPLFSPEREILHNLKGQLGVVKYTTKDKINTQSSTDLEMKINCFEKKMIRVTKTRSFNVKIHVTTIITAGNNTAWVMYHGSDTMYLYGESGKVVRSVTVMKGVNICDMVITPSGVMIVTNHDQKVRCVSVSGRVSTLIDTSPYDARGVCLTDRGEIVLCMSGGDERSHVAVYSSDGHKKLREIRCQDDQGRQLITDPYRVVQNGEDMCVVNYESNVVCVDERGGLRWVYDGTQAKLKEVFDPRGICRDKYHHLLVTDGSNDCVHYIDREGQLIQVILTHEQIGLQYHRGISVDDETGQVWVGSNLNKVVTAKYLQ